MAALRGDRGLGARSRERCLGQIIQANWLGLVDDPSGRGRGGKVGVLGRGGIIWAVILSGLSIEAKGAWHLEQLVPITLHLHRSTVCDHRHAVH